MGGADSIDIVLIILAIVTGRSYKEGVTFNLDIGIFAQYVSKLRLIMLNIQVQPWLPTLQRSFI